jgi:hypothetical protein
VLLGGLDEVLAELLGVVGRFGRRGRLHGALLAGFGRLALRLRGDGRKRQQEECGQGESNNVFYHHLIRGTGIVAGESSRNFYVNGAGKFRPTALKT